MDLVTEEERDRWDGVDTRGEYVGDDTFEADDDDDDEDEDEDLDSEFMGRLNIFGDPIEGNDRRYLW